MISGQKLHFNMSIALVFRPHTVKSTHHRNLSKQMEEKRNKCKDRKKVNEFDSPFFLIRSMNPQNSHHHLNAFNVFFSLKTEINSCFRLDYAGVEEKVLMNTKKTDVSRQTKCDEFAELKFVMCFFSLTVIMLQ